MTNKTEQKKKRCHPRTIMQDNLEDGYAKSISINITFTTYSKYQINQVQAKHSIT